MAVRKEMKSRLVLMLFFTAVLAAAMLPARKAHAVCVGCCNCITIRNYIVSEIDKHEKWLVDTFWKKKVEPAFAQITNQIQTSLVTQTTANGGFAEAQSNSEALLSLQDATAQTAKTYLPSEQLCRYGTLGQSLAASEAKAQANRLIMTERSLGRQLGRPNTVGQGSRDSAERAKNVLLRYCDKLDNAGKNKDICSATNDRFTNADIDYVSTLDTKPTLDIDFTDGKSAATDDEQNIVALADNIFASDLFSRPKSGNLTGDGALNDSRFSIMDMRSLIAKRSVAENSFNTLVGMKARGSGMDGDGKALGSTSYIKNVLSELGMDAKPAEAYLGKAPSYDAQMEVLTKKLYQSPTFYVNLMENPANVDRQYAAMQSFGLMQQRDIFDSIIRSEMLLSLIVELEVAKYQDDAQSLMDR